MTLLELMIVLAVAGSMIGLASFSIREWAVNQRAKDAARAVADAFMLARGEAMRTGNNHIVVFGEAALPNTDADIIIANDDRPAVSNCTFAANDIVHRDDLGAGVNWGTTPGLANGVQAPGDSGLSVGSVAAGTSFTTADLNPLAPASYIYFEPDGIPRLFTVAGGVCTVRGRQGEAGGAIYVTNGQRDFAVVLAPLGTARVVSWNSETGAWTN